MMRIDIATLFPDMCEAVLGESIIGRARSAGYINIVCHNIRDYAGNKHNRVDDKPYGGGTGMIMQAQPIYDCITDIRRKTVENAKVIYMSPQGKTLCQQKVKELAQMDNLIILCGHYEGVDQRVLDELEAEEISVGDYVLTGGELPALILADAVARLQPGVLPNEDAYSIESHYNGLLEHPQYSRPEVWMGREVPAVLLTGHHDNILKWQEKMSFEVTSRKRPDLLYNHRKNGAPFARYVSFAACDKGRTCELWEYAHMLCRRRVFTNREIKQVKKICDWFKEEVPYPENISRENTTVYYNTKTALDIIDMYGPLLEILDNHDVPYSVNFTNTVDNAAFENEIMVICSAN